MKLRERMEEERRGKGRQMKIMEEDSGNKRDYGVRTWRWREH